MYTHSTNGILLVRNFCKHMDVFEVLFQSKTELTKYLLHPVLLYLPRVSSKGVLFAAHAGLTTVSEGSVPC